MILARNMIAIAMIDQMTYTDWQVDAKRLDGVTHRTLVTPSNNTMERGLRALSPETAESHRCSLVDHDKVVGRCLAFPVVECGNSAVNELGGTFMKVTFVDQFRCPPVVMIDFVDST